MPRYGDFIASPPISPHTEGKNYTIVAKSKKKLFSPLNFLVKHQPQLHNPINVTFYVQLSVMRSIAGTVHPVAMILTHICKMIFIFYKLSFGLLIGGKAKIGPE